MELRGHSRSRRTEPAAGGLEAMSGRDIDLKYAPDGETLERALVTGDAVGATRRADAAAGTASIAANTLDVALAPDGSTPTASSARDNVQLDASRRRRARRRDRSGRRRSTARGEPAAGLTTRALHRRCAVSASAAATSIDRRSRRTLDVALAPGLERDRRREVRAERSVRRRRLTATAARSPGTCSARARSSSPASEPGQTDAARRERPDRRRRHAIDVTLDGPDRQGRRARSRAC